MNKTVVVTICALGVALSGAKCSREHVKSVEAMNSCVEYHRRQLFSQAIRDCSKAVSLDPENEKAYHSLGLIYMETKDYEQAANALERAIALSGEVALYHYQLGEAYQALEQWERAAAAFQKAVELDDNMYKAHYRLGRVYEKMDKPKDAMQKYTDALMRNGKFFEAYRDLGLLYYDYYFFPQAEQVLKEGIKALVGRNEELAELHAALGTVYEGRKDHAAAVAEFRTALDLNPGLSNAMFGLGMAYSHVNTDNAKIWLEKFLQSATQDTPAEYLSAAQARLAAIKVGSPISDE